MRTCEIETLIEASLVHARATNFGPYAAVLASGLVAPPFDFRMIKGSLQRITSREFTVLIEKTNRVDCFLFQDQTGVWRVDLVSAKAVSTSQDVLVGVSQDTCEQFVEKYCGSPCRFRRLFVTLGDTGEKCEFGIYVGVVGNLLRLARLDCTWCTEGKVAHLELIGTEAPISAVISVAPEQTLRWLRVGSIDLSCLV